MKENYEKDPINIHIGELSEKAFEKAREKALKKYGSIVEKIWSFLYEIFPDGTKKPIKKLEPDKEIKIKSFKMNLKKTEEL